MLPKSNVVSQNEHKGAPRPVGGTALPNRREPFRGGKRLLLNLKPPWNVEYVKGRRGAAD
jgi:hypothetical protein